VEARDGDAMKDVIWITIIAGLIGLASIGVSSMACAGEVCTQYGNRLECRDGDSYREEYSFGDRTEKRSDDEYTETYQYGDREETDLD
jgi:hypothetical protein